MFTLTYTTRFSRMVREFATSDAAWLYVAALRREMLRVGVEITSVVVS